MFMEKQLPFTEILSNRLEENPDFFNWNRVKLWYCGVASFAGDSEDKVAQLQLRGQRIWLAAIEDLMSKGMRNAKQALLSGCSAGGLTVILHCDEFRNLFPRTTKVKCLSDAGMFLDSIDDSGGWTIICDLISILGSKCFFPQNLVAGLGTPLFLLNAAYDAWQLQRAWLHDQPARKAIGGFRYQMLNAIRDFTSSRKNGAFINSGFAHCQLERQDTWFADESPIIGGKAIALAEGDWFFDRAAVKAIDCAYPCDCICHNLVFHD